ncbi:MAG: FHA domain-containing protein [Lachnospiraceae bacterium]|nr:FHA domain-containing protein [Lachnospiraceae bacterium]
MVNYDQTNRKPVIIIGIISYLIIFVVVGKSWVERLIVKEAAESYLEMIRQGLDDDTVNEVVDSVISYVAGDGVIGSYIQGKVNGDDINDIYHVIIRRMSYRVYAVEKIPSGGYRVGVEIQNNNNALVVKKAAKLFAERYGGNFLSQFWEDLNSDKSRLIAEIITEAAEILESDKGSELLFSQNYVIDLNAEGEIIFENENGSLSFFLACAGIELPAGNSPEIQDECLFYSIFMGVLTLIGVVSAVYCIRNKVNAGSKVQGISDGREPDTTTPRQITTEPDGNSPNQTSASKEGVPILYALSEQHNNMPFALHNTPILIGRDRANCKVVFNEGTVGVSGRHCSISYDADTGKFVLIDLRSTYGTYLINGEKLIGDKYYYLRSGEGFYLGDRSNSFRVEIG